MTPAGWESEDEAGPLQDCKLPGTQQRQRGIVREVKRKRPKQEKLPALTRLNPTLSVQTRHHAPQPPSDRGESGICESRGEAAGTGN